jgi:hypothetical protein
VTFTSDQLAVAIEEVAEQFFVINNEKLISNRVLRRLFDQLIKDVRGTRPFGTTSSALAKLAADFDTLTASMGHIPERLAKRLSGNPVRTAIDGTVIELQFYGPDSKHRRFSGTDAKDKRLYLEFDYQVVTTDVSKNEAAPLPHELRRTPDTFVGRDDVLADALNVIADGATMLALQGMPGVGKTTLALALGERLSADYPSQVFLDLRGNTATPLPPIDVMRYVIQVHRPDKALPTTPKEIAGFYYSVLNGQHTLLVFDNAESAAQLQPLIPPKSCFLLTTSRQHFALPGLAVTELLPLAEADARQLLVNIAPRCAVEAARLAKLCGFLPIALCAVGSALAETIDLQPTEFADRLERTRDRLQLTDPGSNISFQASISLSYKILSRARRRSFEALGILRGSFDLDAAAAIWNIKPEDGRDMLGYLVRHSLVTYDESIQRYSLHDLISTFAETRIPSWRRPLLRRRHALHFLKITSQAGALYDHGNYRLTRGARVLQRAWTNIEPALEYAKNHMRSLYAETLWNCSNYLAATRPPAEWLQLLRSALSTRLLLRKKTRVFYGSLLIEIAHVYIELGEPQTAREWAYRAIAIAFITNDDELETAARTELLYVAYELNEFDREVQRAVAKLAEARATNRPWFIASALETLISRLLIARQYRDAIPYLTERLAIIRTGEATLPVLNLLETLTAAHYHSGEFEAAAAVAREMIEFNRSHRWALYDSWAHAYLGLACAELGDEQAAALSYERRLAGICGLALSPRRLEALADEAIQWSNLSYPDRGYELATIALEGCREQGFLRGQASALLALSLARTRAHEPDQAYRCCVEAKAIADSIENKTLQGLANWALGLFSDDAGDPEAAEQYGKTALSLLEKVRGIDMDLVKEGLVRHDSIASPRPTRRIRSGARGTSGRPPIS